MISDLRAVIAGSFAQNRARTIVAIAAIAFGVALGLAVQLVNASAVDELTQGVRTLSGEADLTVRGPRSGFDEAVFVRLARDADVAVASPAVEAHVGVAGKAEPLRLVGIDAFRAAAVQPALVGDASDRLDTLRPDAVFLSAAARTWLGAKDGDTITLLTGLRDLRVRVAGGIAGGTQERLAVIDIAGAQVALGKVGQVTRVDLRLVPGVNVAATRERLAHSLPPGVAIDRPEATLRATERISRSYRINLNVLALVALFTGGLLVFSTQALSIIRRRSQLALLRTLGVTRSRLTLLCALEGALIGGAGGLLGLFGGYAMAWVAVNVVGGDLGSGFFRGIAPRIDADALALLGFFLLGVATAVIGSVVPARAAARAAPAQALKAGDPETSFAPFRSPFLGIAVIIVGGMLILLPPLDGVPVAGYIAIAALLIGALLLMPVFAANVLAWLPTSRHAPVALATAQLKAASGQASVSLASIVASVSLMVSMTIMVASFRHSLDDWLTRVLPAPLYARVPAAEAGFSAVDQRAIAGASGVARVEFLREEQLTLDASRPRVVLLARPLREADAEKRLPLVEIARPRSPNAPPAAWVNEAMVDLYRVKPGTVTRLPIAGRDAAFYVAGVYRDYGRPQGAVQIDLADYIALTDDRSATTAAIWPAPGTDDRAVRDAVRASIPGGERIELASSGEIRALSLSAFDRTFAVTYALEFAGVAIGLVGLSSAFGALVLARRREFGVLRHLGMTRRQVGAMLATEGLVTSTLGVIVGMALGAVISLILIYVVNRQSFNWGMEMFVPARDLTLFGVAVVGLATLTAIVSGRGAMADDVVRAVKDDW